MVSIVMPAFNEAEIIEASVREWHETVVARLEGAELLVVDDCSTDGTAEILQRLSGELPGMRHLRPAANGGHGRALRFGFGHVKQPYIFQTDSDRQHIPEEFWKLWDVRDAFDFVLGVRLARADGPARFFISGMLRIVNLIVWQVWIPDANCPFKLMTAPALEEVLRLIPADSFIPMVMVSILARKLDFRVREVAVTHIARRGGTQSLKGFFKWMRIGRRCVGEMWDLRVALNSRAKRSA